jgi:two-component system alkaline phosphatase synthesis response regulator PhoP
MNTILVIEDEIQIRENIKEILELSGYAVHTAENGARGFALAQEHRPDLIICDIMMPVMTGYEVLAALRQDDNTAIIPVIFLTARADRHDLRQGMNLGADDYLTKPFELQEVLDAVQARLTRRTTTVQQAASHAEKNQQLLQELSKNRQHMHETQQLAEIKDDLLGKISAELREPLSNINVAIHMLHKADASAERERYIRILKEEYSREMNLLNQVDNLRSLLTAENAKLLQSFNLLTK